MQSITYENNSIFCHLFIYAATCWRAVMPRQSQQRQKPALNKPHLASGISKANMDMSVRPQDNFYRYVNGGWLKTTEIPGDKTAIGSFYDLRDEADENVKAIIEELSRDA